MSINSGVDDYADLGILTHVGQTEFIAGQGAGQRMAEAGVTNTLCVNQEVGNAALDQRCEGFADGLGGSRPRSSPLTWAIRPPRRAPSRRLSRLTRRSTAS